MAIETYKKQHTITKSSVRGSSSNQIIFTLTIDKINFNRFTSYEIKFLLKDRDSLNMSSAYYRGQVINDASITAQSYSTNQDTSYIFNSSTSNNIYIDNNVNIYNDGKSQFEFKVSNSNSSALAYDALFIIEINFII